MRTDDTPRFTEKELRAAHRDGWNLRRTQSPNFKGPYHASFWDFSKLRTSLGLGPRGRDQ